MARTRTPVVRALCLIVALAISAQALPAAGQSCAREDFEAVVQEAASVLTALNQKNKPAMQIKLRQLRDKRGWSPEQFMAEAAPYVRDERTDAYDKRSEELLSKITAMGQDGASSDVADCKLLAELRATMLGLVKAQQEKWDYLFAKLDAALTQ